MQTTNSGVRQTQNLETRRPITNPELQFPKNNGVARNKKRKLEIVGFQNSVYFKLRATIRDLRPYLLEVFRAKEFQDCKAIEDIKKQMKIVLDLYRQLQVESAFHVKEKSNSPVGNSTGPVKTTIPDNISDKPESVGLRIKDVIEEHMQRLQEIKGTYIIGGSPIGWNFLMYPGSKPLYYGVAKETWLSRMNCRPEFSKSSL